MVADEKVEQLLERITALENRVDELEQEKTNLKQENQQLREENKRLRAKLRWYEGPHTPPSKDQSDQEESSSSSDADEDDEQPRTDGGTPGRKPGHDPEWRAAPDPDREIDVTCDCCPECGEGFDESAGVSPDSSRNSGSHSHPKLHSTTAITTSATLVEPRLSLHTPTAPTRGSSG